MSNHARPVRRGRPGNDRGDVIGAAITLFNRHGYEATSVGMIAEQLGVSKSAIYHHVATKEELLRSALSRALDQLEAVLTRAAALGEPNVAVRLEFVLREMVKVLVNELDAVTLLLRLRGNTELERRALERRRCFDHDVISMVEAAIEQGSLRSDLDARTTTRLLFGAVNWMTEWYRPGGTMTAERIGDQLVAIVFDGMLPRA